MSARRRVGGATAGAACAGCCAAPPLLAGAGVGSVIGCTALLAVASASAVGLVTATAAGGLVLRRFRPRSQPLLMMNAAGAADTEPPANAAHGASRSAANRPPTRHWLAAMAALLILTAGLFAIGVSIERSHHHESAAEHPIADATSTETAAAGEAGEATRGNEATEHHLAASATAERPAEHAEATERVFGVNPESTPLVVLVSAASVTLAAALWWRPDRRMLLAVAAFNAIAAAFDIAELAHQIDISDTTVATFAALVAVGHLIVIALATLAVVRGAAPRRAG
jgi:hypothetical protein